MQPSRRMGRTVDFAYIQDSRLELMPLGPQRDTLLTDIKDHNDAVSALQPDYFGYLSISPKWFEAQDALLDKIDKALTQWLSTNPDKDYLNEQVTKLREEVRAQRVRVGNERLIAGFEEHAAPKLLHFIWSGGEIRKVAKDNILAWGRKAKNTGWQVYVWTDEKVNTWSSSVVSELKKNDVLLLKITDGHLDPRLAEAYQILISADKPNYPAASDLARYSILKTMGGVYVDVDIAPGDLPLAETELASRMTLLAPEIRDTQGVRDELGLGRNVKVTPADIAKVARIRIRKGLHNNNFIVAEAGSPVIEAIIVQVVAEFARLEKREGGVRSLLEMADNTAFVTGPAAVKRALVAYAQTLFPKFDQIQAIDLVNQTLVHDLPLRWVTPESDNQEH